jgi:hypothetical protein
VDEVTLPGYEPALYKLPLCQLGPPPFSLVTSKSMLRTRNSSPPAVPPITSADSFALPDDIAMYPPPQILHPDNIEQINQNIIRSSDFETDEESDDDDDDDDNSQNGSFSEFDAEKIAQQRNTIQQSMISEAPSASSFSTSTSGKNPSASSSSSKQLNSSNWEKTLSAASHSFPSLTQPSDKDLKALLTRILEDIFHVIDRLLRLLSKSHSAYKAFAFAFSQAIFIYDRNDREAVEAILDKHNLTWDYALHIKKTAIHRRVRRYVPPPDILCQALETLFACWQDVPCSLDPKRGPLFDEKARKQVKNILQTARLGLMSDPPGIPLYYKIGVDCNGLPYYRCVRGTNSIEGGIHMQLRRTFGSLHASPELTDALLCNIRHRHNTTVGCFNKTGQQHKSHFDQWIHDEIVELAAEVGIKPSFAIPDMLATRIATTESFGIIPVPKRIVERLGFKVEPSKSSTDVIPLYRNIPVHTLSHLSTRRVSAYDFLAECQQTAHAVVPVHTSGEFKLFKTMLNSGGFYKKSRGRQLIAANASRSVDFVKMAKEWTLKVHEAAMENHDKAKRIYYKLPEQLEKYHQSWVQHRGENATLANSVNMRLPITNLLSDINRQAQVLPAIEFPVQKEQPKELTLSQSRKGKQREVEATVEHMDVDMGSY